MGLQCFPTSATGWMACWSWQAGMLAAGMFSVSKGTASLALAKLLTRPSTAGAAATTNGPAGCTMVALLSKKMPVTEGAPE